MAKQEKKSQSDGSQGVAGDGSKPVWDVATHGQPPVGREKQYDVVNG